jgi:DNA polymerase III delta prime subunit
LGFKTSFAADDRPPDPESLFKDLKIKDPEVRYLWSHQADLLRAYDRDHQETPNVALELPTGTGKTLIGLLIAEYRRRKFDERPLYLCPTRQLARQVGEHARLYGVEARVLLRGDYEGLNDFHLGRAVGVTTYSGLFNVNPRMQDPQCIVLDDAHAGEDYMADLWSVDISRRRDEDLYRRLLRLIAPEVEESFVARMLDDDPSADSALAVDMLPHPKSVKLSGEIRALLDDAIGEDGRQRFSWSIIRDHLDACCLYLSWRGLLLRPVIPPTLTHEPFARANQRVYMSATLGEGGELERITGVPRIRRIPAPEGWDRQGSGRRLFLFPNMDMGDRDVEEVSVEAVRESGRALVLTPTSSRASAVEERFSSRGIRVLTSPEIEDSLGEFVDKEEAVLVLANRYDGVDLPGDECRLLVFEGLPAGTNLQERFLMSGIGADSLLRDRLRTRFTQGVGRCCRNASDYAVVLVVGQDLFDFCAKRENRLGMHPELQAELEFGIDNSEGADADHTMHLVRLFYEQGADAEDADRSVRQRREGKRKEEDPAADALMQAVRSEVGFLYDLWKRDYLGALGKAAIVADALSAPGTSAYRSWWLYLAGSAAWLAGEEYSDGASTAKARDLFGRAARTSRSVSWFAGLSRVVESEGRTLEPGPLDLVACEAVYRRLTVLGFYGGKFDRRMGELMDLVGRRESSAFERGLEMLGELLGFEAVRPNGEGDPDGVWLLGDRLAIVLEAKSEEAPEHAVSLSVVRQAVSHPSWVRARCRVSSDAEVVNVLVTPRETVDEGAARNAEDLYHVPVKKVRQLAGALEAALRRARSRTTEAARDDAVEVIREELEREGLLPTLLLATLRSTPVRSLATPA